ncbi:MAG: ATP-binding protein [Phycisphaerae bacterium]
MADHHALHIRITRNQWDNDAADMRSTLQTWEWRWQQARTRGAVLLDFSEVNVMEPWAIALFACFGLALQRDGVRVDVALDNTNPVNQQLETDGIRDVLSRGAPARAADLDLTSTGLYLLHSIADGERFARRAAALVRSADAASGDHVQYCVGELARNVVQHADSPGGGVALARRAPHGGALQIAVCDAGRGVRASLAPFYTEVQTDLEALRLATLPHTSGAVPPGPYGSFENMGLGLFISKEIAWRTGGGFWLASGSALLGVRDSEHNGPQRVHRRIEPWNGTLAAVHLPDPTPTDFQDVLEVCLKAASDVQRDPASVGLEFLDASAELSDDTMRIAVAPIQDDLVGTHALRRDQLQPALVAGRQVALELRDVRFLSTSIAQALLGDAFRQPGSLTKLVFLNASKSTQLAIRAVAALAKATYRLRPS